MSREAVLDEVRKRFMEKVVAAHEEDEDGSSSDQTCVFLPHLLSTNFLKYDLCSFVVITKKCQSCALCIEILATFAIVSSLSGCIIMLYVESPLFSCFFLCLLAQVVDNMKLLDRVQAQYWESNGRTQSTLVHKITGEYIEDILSGTVWLCLSQHTRQK